jgi:glycine/D-amino acid oxidase-like deaminating enzyme
MVREGVRVRVGDRDVVADAVVLAAEAWSPAVHEYFEDKITPVREHGLITAPTALPLYEGIRGQHGWFAARVDVGGRLVARGARWATPHMEVGERDETPSPKVIERLEALVRARFPSVAAVPVVDRWAWIEAATCDGLPIVGPIPGSARFVSCVGFGGSAGMAVRAARAVADGLLGGRAPGVPASFGADRFVG